MPGRIYVNEPINESPTWLKRTVSLDFQNEGSGVSRMARAWANARIAQRRAGPDDLVICSDSHNLSATLYGLTCAGRRERPTFVRTDPLLTPGHLGLLNSLRRAYLRRALAGADRIIVWAPAVMDRYAQLFGIPRERMVAQRFHHTLRGYATDDQTTGQFIFSGGDSMRDYQTLIDAVRGLSVPVFIATRRKLSIPDLPPNVQIAAISHNEFRTRMAGAMLVVFPLRMDNIRTSGQQSYLNAMAMGKPVIVTDTTDAPYYIESGKTGLLVPPGNPQSLRDAIQQVLDRPAWGRDLGQAAREVALPMDQEFTWSNVLRIAEQTHAQRRASSGAALADSFAAPA